MEEYGFGYFQWIHDFCIPQGKSYYKLLGLLHQYEYRPLHPMDENNVGNGVYLRYKYGYHACLDRKIIDEAMTDKTCSCLEMMGALSRRLGEFLLTPDDGFDPMSAIFMDMLKSMGVSRYDDEHFNIIQASNKIEKCFSGEYDETGRGGLFFVPGCKENLRLMDIWYQAQLFIRKKYS